MAKNYSLEIRRLEVKKQNTILSTLAMELRIAELEDEISRLSENLPVYKADLENIDREIAALESEKASYSN